MMLNIVADKMNAMMCATCSNGYFTYLNPYWSNVLGWSIEEIMTIPFIDYVHPEDRDLTIKVYHQLLAGQDVSNFRNRYRKRSGEYVWLQWCATPLPQGGVVASVHQIDDVVLVENKLKQHTVLLEQVSGIGKPGHWSINLATQSIFWSKEIYVIHGVTPDQYTPELESAISFYHPEDAQRVSDLVNNSLANGKSWNFTLRIIRPDGAIRTVRSLAEIARDENGHPISVFGVFQDVTDYVALNEQVQLLSHVANASNAGIVICDNDRKVVWVNTAFTSLSGYGLDELVGRGLGQLLQGPKTDQNTVQEIRSALNKGENIDKEILNYHKNGSEYWANLLISPIRGSEGSITHIVGIQNDITEKKRAEQRRDLIEEQLKHAQKMESIGQLAAGIAHEINTPSQFVGDNLSFILHSTKNLIDYHKKLEHIIAKLQENELINQADIAKKQLDIDFLVDELPQAIEESVDGVFRISEIVSAMKDFSHPGKDDKQTTDINRAIESTTIVARNEWKYVADIQFDFSSDVLLVNCFPGEINQVILNIIINSCYAIKDSGEVKVKGNILISTLQEDNTAIIKIKDNGAGISADIIKKVFDPFFTTKEVGQGTGQGLSLAYNIIVEKHGGKIFVESAPGEGTTFTIELPR